MCMLLQASLAEMALLARRAMMQASMDMLLGSRFAADHESARHAALALQLHSVPPAIASKPLPSQRRCCCQVHIANSPPGRLIPYNSLPYNLREACCRCMSAMQDFQGHTLHDFYLRPDACSDPMLQNTQYKSVLNISWITLRALAKCFTRLAHPLVICACAI